MTAGRFACPLCPDRFRTTVALRFHAADEHPGDPGTVRLAVREMRAAERVEDRARRLREADEANDKTYRAGCVCGHSFEWHMEQRARLRPPGAAP